MSHLPALPNQRDIAEMARLKAIMDGTNVPALQQPIQGHYTGGSAGVRQPMKESRNYIPPIIPSFGPSRDDVNSMKILLEKINNLDGKEESSIVNSGSASRALLETSSSIGAHVSTLSTGPYEILISLKENAQGKEVRSYNVVDSSRCDIVSGLVLQEAAQAILKLLNKGLASNSSRVQEIVDLEEDYNRNRIEAGRHKARYQRSIELGENAAADVFKSRFSTAKANALASQDQIKSILESIR